MEGVKKRKCFCKDDNISEILCKKTTFSKVYTFSWTTLWRRRYRYCRDQNSGYPLAGIGLK